MPKTVSDQLLERLSEWGVRRLYGFPGESPAEATEREVWEEAGYRVRATRLLALYDRSRHGQESDYGGRGISANTCP